VCISVDKQLAGFEHLLHVRQSTVGSVITECVKEGQVIKQLSDTFEELRLRFWRFTSRRSTAD
jgi:hypothetical protein